MPESELAKEIKEVIKKADKLVDDIRGDTFKLLKALKQLKEHLGSKEDRDEGETKQQ